MTINVIREVVAYNVNRGVSYQIVRSPSGPMGPPGLSAQTYFAIFIDAFPGPGDLLYGAVIPGVFPVSAGSSLAAANIPATGTVVIPILVNGVEQGTITFAPASPVGVVAWSITEITNGQILSFLSPNPLDATLAGIFITLGVKAMSRLILPPKFDPEAAIGVGMSSLYEFECRDRFGKLKWRDAAKNRVVTAGLNNLLANSFTAGLTTPAWYVGLCGPSVTDGVMTASSPNLACTTSTPFTAGDVGSPIIVKGAGAAQADLVTTILTFTDSGHVVLNTNASTAVSGANVIFGARAADTMASHAPWLDSAPYSNATRPAWTGGAVSAGSVNNSGSPAVFNINADNTLIGGAFLVNNSTVSGTTGTLYGMAPMSTIGFRSVNNGDSLTLTITLSAASQ